MSKARDCEMGPPRNEEEVQQFARVQMRSLQVPPLEKMDWAAREGIKNFRFARRGGRVVGGLSVQETGQWFGGRSLPMGAVRFVGVAPEYRSEGIASACLRATLEELQEKEIPLSALYPATQPVYRRAGYEQAGVRVGYLLPLEAIDLRDRSLEIRHIEEEGEAEPLRTLYKERARRTNGNLDRSDWFWMRLLQDIEKKPVYQDVIYQGDQAKGYIIYNYHKDEKSGHEQILVRDWATLTAQASRRLLTFLADQRSVVREVVWYGGPQEPLLTFVPNPKHKVFLFYPWMLRLVDLRRALLCRGYSPALRGELHLEVVDEILPWNEGRFVLTVEQGEAGVQGGGRGELRLSVRGLASLYSGHLSAQEARSTELVEGSSSALDLAGALFAGPTPWMSEMF